MKKSGMSPNENGVRRSAGVPVPVNSTSNTQPNMESGKSPFVVEEFDYSQFGKFENPNTPVAQAARKPQPANTQKRSSTAPSGARRTTASSSNAKRPTGKKKKSQGNSKGVKIAAIAMSVIAVGAVAVFVMVKTGVIKERYEVTMADGSISKYTANQLYNQMSSEVFADGIFIDEMDMSGKTVDEARALIVQAQSQIVVKPDIKLEIDGQQLPVDMGNLDLTYNTEEILNEAYQIGRVSNAEDVNALVAAFNQRQQLKNNPAKFVTAFTAATPEIDSLIDEILTPFVVMQSDATILGFDIETNTFQIQPEVIGRGVDVAKASADVKEMLDSGTYNGVVKVLTEEMLPEITTDFINKNYGKISSASSKTSDNNNRNHNISTACKKIDGLVLNPGDSFSFNGVVGERTVANGFKAATVIAGGQYEQGLGGGICQVSSMLYNAVVKANLQIDHRAAHAWPSTYCDVGTDATVDYGNIDFNFTNNTEYQIVIRAYFNSKNSTITCEVYGHFLENNMTIKFIGTKVSTGSTDSSKVEYVENKKLAAGKTNVVRNAHPAITAKSYQVWYDADGNEVSRNEVDKTYYRAYAKKVEVGTLMPDGSYAKFDSKTGTIITPTPAPTVAPTQAPTEPKPTEAPADQGGDQGGEN